MLDFIEKLRTKPGHIRHRIAIGTAVGMTALIALSWIAVISVSHPFSEAQFYADAPGSNAAPIATAKSTFQNLLGAVGAAGGSDAPPGITVVTESSTTVGASQPTVIPF